MKQTAKGREISLVIDNLNSEGQGVARSGRDVYFVPGGLPGETVRVRMLQRSKKIWHTQLIEIESDPSSERSQSDCAHYQRCGGCDIQHMQYDAQVQFKRERVARELSRQKVPVAEWAESLTGTPWHYRRKARLGVRFSKDKQKNFIGFREAASTHITDIDHCAVLPEHPALDWAAWRTLIGSLDASALITQIEPLWADSALVFILRTLKPLSEVDTQRLVQAFEAWQRRDSKPIQLWLRTEKNAAPEIIWPSDGATIWHEVYGLKLEIQADDFIQVNRDINQAMVKQAMEWLQPQQGELIWDLFAGHGNFSMPLATQCQHVVAVEGQQAMTDSLQRQAEKLALSLQTKCADLSASESLQALPEPDAVLLDPPRAGAIAVMTELIRRRVDRILYVSCDPATLARDLVQLVQADYEVIKAGIMDMFPQTHHVETMVLLKYRGK